MDPKHSAEISKHLDKQNQALMETYRAMSHELHKLQRKKEGQPEQHNVVSTQEQKGMNHTE